MAANDLTTPDNATDWLGIAIPSDAQNSRIVRLITTASSRIQAFIGYQIASATYTRTFDGHGGRTLILPDRPVTAISSIQIGSTPIQGGVGGLVGFYAVADGVELAGSVFPCGRQNVSVTYTAGYASTPAEIEQACLEYVSALWQGQDRDPAVIAQRAGDTEFKYAQQSAGNSSSLMLPPSIAGALQPYRRVA